MPRLSRYRRRYVLCAAESPTVPARVAELVSKYLRMTARSREVDSRRTLSPLAYEPDRVAQGVKPISFRSSHLAQLPHRPLHRPAKALRATTEWCGDCGVRTRVPWMDRYRTSHLRDRGAVLYA